MGFVRRAIPRIVFVAAVCAALTGLPAAFDVPATDVEVLSEVAAAPRPLEDIELGLDVVVEVARPTAIAVRYEDPALYIASKTGEVHRLLDGELEKVLDVSDEVSGGFEQGLLGLAFSPDGMQLVVNFTNKKDASITRSYLVEGGQIDPRSGKDLLEIPKPAEVHNAGNLAFGPDDYLYLSLGDGGLSGDPKYNAQSKKTLLGKVHRIELLPDQTYGIPADNPYAGFESNRGEIWAYGFRNPWRFSFDRKTGDLWIADVGRDAYEEINFQPSAAEGGRNYGWNYYEGPKKYADDRLTDRKKPKEHIAPIHAYKHNPKVCAVAGGFVYRGTDIDGLDGAYLYTDFCRGGIDAIRLDPDGTEVVESHHWDLDVVRASSFGQDADGELYVLALTDGVVYKVVAAGG